MMNLIVEVVRIYYSVNRVTDIQFIIGYWLMEVVRSSHMVNLIVEVVLSKFANIEIIGSGALPCK